MNNFLQNLSGMKLYYFFLHFITVSLSVLVIVLADQNKALKNQITRPQEVINAGDYFSLANLQPIGQNTLKDTVNQKQLIIVFTTRCPQCRESIPVWKRLADSQNETLTILGISLDERDLTSKLVEEQRLTFPIFTADKVAFYRANKISSVPYTLLRDKNGFVKKIWRGALPLDKLQEIESYLKEQNFN